MKSLHASRVPHIPQECVVGSSPVLSAPMSGAQTFSGDGNQSCEGQRTLRGPLPQTWFSLALEVMPIFIAAFCPNGEGDPLPSGLGGWLSAGQPTLDRGGDHSVWVTSAHSPGGRTWAARQGHPGNGVDNWGLWEADSVDQRADCPGSCRRMWWNTSSSCGCLNNHMGWQRTEAVTQGLAGAEPRPVTKRVAWLRDLTHGSRAGRKCAVTPFKSL